MKDNTPTCAKAQYSSKVRDLCRQPKVIRDFSPPQSSFMGDTFVLTRTLDLKSSFLLLFLFAHIGSLWAQVPTITSFTPTSGAVGATVTITGTNFSATPANNLVYFGSTRATVTAATTTSLTVTVPVGATFAQITEIVTTNGLACQSSALYTPTFSPNKSTLGTSDFAPKVDLSATAGYDIAFGDLDGDGKSDIVLGNGSNNVGVYLNTSSSGTISFSGPTNFAFYSSSTGVALADLDGDGKLDLAGSNLNGAPNVSVMLNTSTGVGNINFGTRVDYSSGNKAYDMRLADIDGDGKKDLIYANSNDNTFSVRLNACTPGVQNFGNPTNFTATMSGDFALEVADFDNDGKLDVTLVSYNTANLYVFRNTSTSGATTFTTFGPFTVQTGTHGVAVGDMDGDGKIDIATGSLYNSFVSILRNTSSGAGAITFATKIDYATNGQTYDVALGDLNGDGKIDLAVSGNTANTVLIYANTSVSGAISFGSYSALTCGAAPYGIAIGDLDGDGKADIATGNNTASTISVFRNTPAFPPTITSFSPTSGAPGATVTITGTNFNTTPANNIVYFGATKATVSAATATSLTVTVPAGATYAPITVLNTGTSLAAYSLSNFTPIFSPAKTNITTADFSAKQDFTTGTTGAQPSGAVIGDIDGDGKPDLVVMNYSTNTVSVLRNTSTSGSIGSGSFATKVDFTVSSNPIFVQLGDIDGDGKLDIVVPNNNSNFISVLRNTSTIGSISFATKVDFATGNLPISAAIGDLDGDGKLDLATGNYLANTISVLRNTSTIGSISFATKVDFTTGTAPYSTVIGDLDGDGKPDLATANRSSDNVSVLHNTSTTGSISFAVKVDFTAGSNPFSVAIGDLNGDGKPELVAANFGSGASTTVSVFNNTSTSGSITSGSFATQVTFTTGTKPYTVAIGDLDGDGKPDLATANETSSNVSVLRNTSTTGTITSGSFAANVNFAATTGARCVAIGDLDGDGKPDLVATNAGGTTVSVFRNAELSNNANLSALTTTAGTIAPTFAAATTAYTASVANATASVTVTPTKADANATIQVRVNGGTYATVASGAASAALALNVGANPIDVQVTAENGTTIKTYTITVTRAPSSVATLSAMTLSSGTLSPTFASATTAYTANVTSSASTITVTPTSSNSGATIQVQVNSGGYSTVTSGSASSALALNFGANTIQVKVTAQDGTTIITYTTTVTRANYTAVTNNGNWNTASTWDGNAVPPSGADVIIDATGVTLSSNVTVHSITVNTGKSITHSSNTLNVQNGFITNNGTFTSNAAMGISGTVTVSGIVSFTDVHVQGTIDFGSNSTLNGQLVIYYGGSVVNRPTYGNTSGLFYTGAGTIVVGNEWPTGNINIGSLYVASGTVLDFGTISTPRQLGAGRGSDVYQNDGTINLSSVSGGDLILESVYLYNAGTLNANQRTVTVQGPSNHHIQNAGSGITFYNLVFGAGGSINVPLTVTNNLNLTAGCTMDVNSSVTLESGATNTGSGRLNMVNGNGFVKIKNITTARTFPLARGGFSSTYTPLTISDGQGLDYTVKMNSTNPSGGTLSAYTAARTFKGQWDITPSAAPASPVTLAFQYNDGDLLSGSNAQNKLLTHYVSGQWTEVTGNVATPTGTNPYTVSFAYSGTFSPFSFGGTPSNNADLSALTTTAGTISPIFASATTSYTASVANATASVTVTPTKADANATIQVRVNGGTYATVTSGAASSALALNVGANPIDVKVTAEDGTTIKTYTISVCRLPIASISGNNGPICSGSDATFTLTGSSDATVTYNINGGANTTATLTGGTAIITLTAPSANQTLNLVDVSHTGCANTLSGNSTVVVNNPSVAPTSISGTSTICNGSSTTLTAVGGTLGTGANYQWGTGPVAGTNPLSGETAATLTISPTSTTTYWVRIVNTTSPCTATTGGVTQAVTVNNPSVAPTSISGTSTICNGSATTLTAVGGTLGTGANYQWGTGSVAGTNPLSGETAATLTVSPTSTTTYWVRIENGASPCAANTSGLTQAVTVNNPSVAPTSITGTSTICNGSATTLTAVGGTLGTGANYQWGTGSVAGTNPLSGETAATLTISPTSTTTYWVRIENGTSPCAANTSELTQAVTVNNPSVAPTSISGTNTICNGSSTTLTAVGGTLGTGANYQWGTGSVAGTNPLSGETAATLTVSPTSTTTYWVRIENGTSPCVVNTSGLTQAVTVNTRPTSSIIGTQTICNGNSINLFVLLTGTAPWSLTYTDGTTPVTVTGISSSPNSFSISPSATSTYTISALSDAVCTAQAGDRTGSAVITINYPPSITTAAASNSPICAGTTLNLSVAASGTAPLTYAWAGTGTFANGTTATPTVTGAATGNYVATISNGCGSVSSIAAVTVNAPSVAPTSITGTNTICNGSATTLTAAGGTLGTGANYQWGTGSVVGTNPLAGQTTATLNVSPTSTTTYWVRIENGTSPCATTTSGVTQTVTVNNPSVAPTSITGTSTICNGGSTTLTAVGGTLGTGANYQWGTGSTVGANPLSGETAATLTVSPTSTTTYWVRIENGASPCTANTSGVMQTITVSNPSVAPTSITGTSAICNGGSTTLTAVGGTLGTSANYQWGIGSVAGTNPLTGETTTTLNVAPTSTTTYWVRIENTATSCAANTSGLTQAVTVNARPTSTTIGTQTICNGNTANMFAILTGTGPWDLTYTDGTAPVTVTGITTSPYSFTKSPSTTTTYTVTALSDALCTSQAGDRTGSAVITVNNPSVAPSSIVGTTTICDGGSTTLMALGGTLGTGANYQWGTGSVVGTNPLAGETSASLTISPTFTTTYWVRIENTAGPCAGATAGVTETVTVNIPSIAPTAITGTSTICNGGSTTLTVVGGTLGTGANYKWGLGSVVGVNPASGQTGASIFPAPSTTTTYWVRIENTAGPCPANTSGLTQTVTVNNFSLAPTVILGTNTICDGGSTTLTAGGGALGTDANYQWGTGSAVGISPLAGETAAALSVSPTSTTTYWVRIENTTGPCAATTNGVTQVVTVNPLPTASITANNSPVCSGTDATFTLTGTLDAVVSYTLNGTAGTATLTGGTATVTATSVTSDKVLVLTSINNPITNCSQSITGTSTVTVNTTPTVTATPASQSICPSGTITNIALTNPNSVSGTVFTWSRDNTTVLTGIGSTGTGTSISGSLASTTPGTFVTTTFTITATANGCSSNTTSTVSVGDTIAPVANVASLPNVTGECGASATAPTATDNCTGSVTATTSDPLSYSVQGTYTIHWTYNDGNGNTSTQNQTVIVDDVTNPVAVCSPLSVTLSNTTGDYTLNAANLSTMGAGSNDNCTSAGNLSFSAMPNNFNCITLGAQAVVLTVNDGNGNDATCNTTVTVNNYVTANAGVDTTICDNSSVTLAGTGMGGAGTYNYVWTPAATLANPTTSTPTATPTANQLYTLTVTDPFGCSATSTVMLSLISAPSAPISGGNKCAFAANSPTLDLAVTGTNVEWYSNATHSGTAISTSSTYTATTTGNYYAYEVAGNGCYSNPTALSATIRTNLPTAIPTSVGYHLATDKVVDNGWSYYCDCPNNELLLALEQGTWNPGTLVNILNPASGQYAIRTDVGASLITNLTAAPYNSDLTGWQVISRTWDVVLNNAGQEPNANGVASVGVRSYFTQAEFNAINATFTTPLSSPSKLTVYKLDSITAPTGSLYASSMAALEAGHVGIDKNHIELYNNQTPYLPDWTYIANNVAADIHAAEMSVTEFSGGGGGGGNNGGAPFPISLTKFNGYNENVSNRLFWTTESELNADRFIVERSNDNTDFTVVGEVIAVGNSATVQNYTFNDRTFNAKNNFYRLKMLDKDGTFAYSKVIEITMSKLNVTIYPNPAQNEVFIAGNFPVNAKVSLSNMLGQEMLNMNLDATNQTAVSLQNIPQGVYMLNILNEKGVIMHTEKLVRE